LTSQRRRLAARRKNKETGSLPISEPVFVQVGMLRRPHGLKGETLVSIDTDFPERLKVKTKLFLGEDHLPVTIASRRQHNDGLLLAFAEFPDKDSLEQIRNLPLFVHISDIPKLPDGEYYQHQLLGLDIVEEDGKVLGPLIQIMHTGANDVYVVREADGKELLLPAIRDVLQKVDLEKKQIIVRLLPGLRPDETE
jgi:16S rRNA processing protein RimM